MEHSAEKHTRYPENLHKVDELLARNQELCNRIVENALDFYAIDRAELDKHVKSVDSGGKKADKVSVSQSLKHIVRDWTVSGGPHERDAVARR